MRQGVSPVPVQMWQTGGCEPRCWCIHGTGHRRSHVGARAAGTGACIRQSTAHLGACWQMLRHVVPRRKEKNWMPFAHSRAGKESL
jgi:hypothetical protein